MERDNLMESLKNVRLTSREVYDDSYRELIKRKSDSFDPKALRTFLAIQPGHAFQATIVLEEDFELINGILIAAGPLVVPHNPRYRDVTKLVRAILPDEAACAVLDTYVENRSYVYSQPVPSQWNPVLVTMNFFQTPKYSGTDTSSDSGLPASTDDNGSIQVSLSCL